MKNDYVIKFDHTAQVFEVFTNQHEWQGCFDTRDEAVEYINGLKKDVITLEFEFELLPDGKMKDNKTGLIFYP